MAKCCPIGAATPWFSWILAMILAPSAVGCGSDSEEKDDLAANSDDPVLSLDDPGSGSDSETSPEYNRAGCGSLRVADACAGAIFEGELLPLDIQIIFDQSGSMATLVDDAGDTRRVDAVGSALDTFLSDTDSAGIGVGLSFFGYQPIGKTTCDEADFSHAAVEFAELPGNADAIVKAVAEAAPTGETPTGPAIRGGCSLAAAQKRAHPERTVINLLVTDGEPQAPVTMDTTSCNPTMQDAEAAARECLDSDERVATYVLGVGPLLENLDSIAKAGGTDAAYLVSDDSSDTVLEALYAIRYNAQVPCDFGIDTVGTSDPLVFSQTSVVYTTPDCELVHVQRVFGKDECDKASGGWYFDDDDAPTRIALCSASCDAVSIPRARLSYAIGCSIEAVY